MNKRTVLVMKTPELHARFKAAASQKGQKLWEVTEEAVLLWFEKETKRAKAIEMRKQERTVTSRTAHSGPP